MDQDQQRSLHILGSDFTISEAAAALDWTGTNRALAKELEALGYQPLRRRRRDETQVRKVWRAPPRLRDDCECRCHTGTCGENAMVLAERTIRLVEKLRPLGADTIQALVDLVDRAGVDFARATIGADSVDDDVPF